MGHGSGLYSGELDICVRFWVGAYGVTTGDRAFPAALSFEGQPTSVEVQAKATEIANTLHLEVVPQNDSLSALLSVW